jgi:hypothetical protein
MKRADFAVSNALIFTAARHTRVFPTPFTKHRTAQICIAERKRVTGIPQQPHFAAKRRDDPPEMAETRLVSNDTRLRCKQPAPNAINFTFSGWLSSYGAVAGLYGVEEIADHLVVAGGIASGKR